VHKGQTNVHDLDKDKRVLNQAQVSLRKSSNLYVKPLEVHKLVKVEYPLNTEIESGVATMLNSVRSDFKYRSSADVLNVKETNAYEGEPDSTGIRKVVIRRDNSK